VKYGEEKGLRERRVVASCARVWVRDVYMRDGKRKKCGTQWDLYVLCICETRAQPIAFDERRKKKRFDRNQKTHPDVSGNSDVLACVCIYMYV
jgi:hypothetical protein